MYMSKPDLEPPRPVGRPRLTHCKNGHARTDNNVYVSPSGHRACRLCNREAQERHAAKKRDGAPPRPVGAPRKAFCKNGHPRSGENLYVAPDGRRYCRQCQRDAAARYESRHRAEHTAELIASLGDLTPTPEELLADERQRRAEERLLAAREAEALADAGRQ